MLDSFKRASAARITAVLPYYGYARQDRKDVGRVPITAKLVADLLTAAGADRVLALDLHAAQIQGFFDIPVDHLHAAPVINDYVRSLNIPPQDFVVLSPDEGSIKRTLLSTRRSSAAPIAIVDKRRVERHRDEAGQPDRRVAGGQGRRHLRRHDLDGRQRRRGGRRRQRHGAREVYACATHGVLCGPAIDRLRDSPFKQIVVTDSIPLPPEQAACRTSRC